MTTDAQRLVGYNLDTMMPTEMIAFKDNLDFPPPPLKFVLGSAHPVRSSSTCVTSVDPQVRCTLTALAHTRALPKPSPTNPDPPPPPWQGYFIGAADLLVYELCDDEPDTRKQLSVSKLNYMPYVHSFGLSENYAVVPLQHTTLSFADMIFNGSKTLQDCFKPAGGSTMDILLAPRAPNLPSQTFSIPNSEFFYTHLPNAFETSEAVVFDVSAYKSNPFTGGVVAIKDVKSKADRDRIAGANNGIMTRYTLWTSGARKGQVDVTPLSPPTASTDFVKVSPNRVGQKHCFYWGVEWQHNAKHGSPSYGAMAIVKQSLCAGATTAPEAVALGEPVYFYAPNEYPSEPFFQPSTAPGAAEDEGNVLFTLMNGVTGASRLIVLDGVTMQTVSTVELPMTFTFTLHLEFYPAAKL